MMPKQESCVLCYSDAALSQRVCMRALPPSSVLGSPVSTLSDTSEAGSALEAGLTHIHVQIVLEAALGVPSLAIVARRPVPVLP